MMVIDDRNTQVGGTASELVEQAGERGEIRRRQRAGWPLIDDLQILSAGIAQEPGVFHVPLDLRRGVTLDRYGAARQRHQRQPVLLQQAAEFGRAIAERIDRRRSELDAAKADVSDVVDRLAIPAPPRDGGVSELQRSLGERSAAAHREGDRGRECGQRIPARHDRCTGTGGVDGTQGRRDYNRMSALGVEECRPPDKGGAGSPRTEDTE
jgi:hypothetical protein